MFNKLVKFFTLGFLTALVVCGGVYVAPTAAHADDVSFLEENLTPEQLKVLRQETARSLVLARYSIKVNGFFCAKIELNLWKNLAERTGTFDAAIYDELKTELYEKSLRHLDKWFEYYVKKGYHADARRCLQLWRLHAMEIHEFDEDVYAKKLAALKAVEETTAN